MHVRFVIHSNDESSGRRQGLFQALAELEQTGALLPHEQEAWLSVLDWFRHHLGEPDSFARSSKPHAKKVALSWFKSTATEHVKKMYALAAILESHGVPVDVIKAAKPGYIVYEDDYQVAAEPFSETRT
jgi:hypothetical protein